MIGKQISHFRILEKIGEGGMGVVYRAEDQRLGRDVALKVLQPEFMAQEARRKRFLREARTAASVTHPNIATVHEIDEVDGVIFIAMELVEGQTLSSRLESGPLPASEALRVAMQLAEGLARAHSRDIVHRDLKPENIILGPDGHAKLLDFGLAKLADADQSSSSQDALSGFKTLSVDVTREGRIVGTVAYMSPEQARGLPLDSRADIFSFGIVLYEMAAGRPPFHGETVTDTLTAILRDPQPPMAKFNRKVPAEAERIVAKCLEKEPADRYQHADEIIVDLRKLKRQTDSDSVSVPLVSDSSRDSVAPVRNRIGMAWLLAAGAVALMAILVGFLPGWQRGREAINVVENSLAVLPFDNLQDGGDQDRFGQILQELIITDLSEVESLPVFSSQRLFDIQKQLGRVENKQTIDRDLASEVASRAGASRMLTGSVSQLGQQWILTSQLVDVGDGTVITSERIDGTDLYAMVDELTAKLRADLGLHHTAGLGLDLAVRDRTTDSLEAYKHYLAGVDELNALEFTKAAQDFARATEVDPDFGKAYYKLAIARWWARGLTMEGDAPPDEKDAPGRVLEELLTSDVKLTRKDRALSRGFKALVGYDYADARDQFEQVVLRFPDEKEAWYGLGEARYHLEGRPFADNQVLEPFERALELDPEFRLAYRHVVDLYLEQQRYDEVRRQADEWLAANPDYMPAYSYRFQAAVAVGDREAAEEALAAALEHAPSAAVKKMVLMESARAYRNVGDESRAYRTALRAVEELSEEADAGSYATLGWTALRLGQLDRAETWFERAEEHGPSPESQWGRFRVAVTRDEFDAASEMIGKLRESIGEDQARMGAFEEQLNRGELEAAREILTTGLAAVESDPKRRGLLLDAAWLYMMNGHLAQAEQRAREAARLDPAAEVTGIYKVLAIALLHRGEAVEAELQLRKASQRDPADPDPHLLMATIDLLEQRHADAEAAVREMLERGPVTAAAHRTLALVLADQERLDEALEPARAAYDMSPDHRNHILLAWVLIAGDLDLDRGVELLNEAEELSPARGEAAMTFRCVPSAEHARGLALMKRGEFAAAVRLLEKGAQLRPDRLQIREHLEQARSNGRHLGG